MSKCDYAIAKMNPELLVVLPRIVFTLLAKHISLALLRLLGEMCPRFSQQHCCCLLHNEGMPSAPSHGESTRGEPISLNRCFYLVQDQFLMWVVWELTEDLSHCIQSFAAIYSSHAMSYGV